MFPFAKKAGPRGGAQPLAPAGSPPTKAVPKGKKKGAKVKAAKKTPPKRGMAGASQDMSKVFD